MISVIMSVYNHSKYLHQAVKSVLCQTYKDFELILIDDGSTDNVKNIINKFDDSRIIFFQREHLGLINQLNFGIAVSKGEYIARMDADDCILPHKFKIQIDFLENNKDIQVVGTNFSVINENNEIILNKKLPENHEEIEFMMPIIDCVLHPSILTYRELLIQSGGYNIEYTYAEDDELFLRLLGQGCRMHNIQEFLHHYRIIYKSKEYYYLSNKNYYKSSSEYLKNYYREKNSKEEKNEYFYRFGLLEYYRGSIPKARKYFFKCLFNSGLRYLKVIRFLFPTFLGSSILNFVRNKRITEKLNFFLLNKFSIDSYKINKY